MSTPTATEICLLLKAMRDAFPRSTQHLYASWIEAQYQGLRLRESLTISQDCKNDPILHAYFGLLDLYTKVTIAEAQATNNKPAQN